MAKRHSEKRQNLTARIIAQATVETGEANLADSVQPGLYVRVRPNSKSFVVRYRVAGRSKRYTIGSVADLSLPAARGKAKEVLEKVALGGDPQQEKVASRQAPTVADFAEEWMEKQIRPMRSEKTAGDYRRMLNRYINPRLGRRLITELGLDHIEALHRSMQSTPAAANRVLAVISSMLTWAERRRARPPNTNPCKAIEKFAETSRERVLSDDEFSAIFGALNTLVGEGGNQTAARVIRVMAMTGWRQKETRHLRWENLERKAQVVTLKVTKNGIHRPADTPPEVLEVFDEGGESSSPFIFPGASDSAPISAAAVNKLWLRCRDVAGVRDAKMHDLRRRFATRSLAQNAPRRVVQGLLGHESDQVINVYARRADAEQREWAGKMAKQEAALMQAGGKNVVRLR